MENWKFLLTIILFSFMTSSCKKTASDIDINEIDTPCEWLEAYEIVVLEYYEFVDKNSKEYQQGIKDLESFEKKIDKKRKFYDNLLIKIKALPNQLKSIDMPGPCNREQQKVIDKKYTSIYDSLLLRISPNYVAESYLNAIMNHDFERAKVFSDSADYDNMDMLKELKADFRMSEVKDVNCEVKEKNAICSFCCTADTMWKDIRLLFAKGHWFIQPSKDEIPPQEEE